MSFRRAIYPKSLGPNIRSRAFECSGTLSGIPFVNQPLTFDVTADTSTLTNLANQDFYLTNTSLAATVGSLGTVYFSGLTNSGTDDFIITFGFGVGNFSDTLTDFTNITFATYQSNSSLGPLTIPQSLTYLDWSIPIATSGGPLGVTAYTSPLTFEATLAPEPSPFLLMTLGLALLLFKGWAAKVWTRR
jgi:hypothetical protein